MKKYIKGFTLVELLIVVAIIAILAAIGTTVYSGIQGSARDAKRRADIDSISKAMEAHVGDTSIGATVGNYAGLCQTTSAPAYDCTSPAWFAGGALPTDPAASGTRRYCWIASGTCNQSASTPTGTALDAGQPLTGTNSWVICATMEDGTTTYCKAAQQ